MGSLLASETGAGGSANFQPEMTGPKEADLLSLEISLHVMKSFICFVRESDDIVKFIRNLE